MVATNLQVHETDSLEEYFDRLERRIRRGESVGKKIIRIQQIAKSAEDHFKRLSLPQERYLRAIEMHDDLSAAFERRTMLALLYEIVDTSFIVMNLLDFDELDLESSQNGHGLTGNSAFTVVHILTVLDDQCATVAQIEKEFDLIVDFVHPVDEKRGITYEGKSHWQDFFPGSVEKSFHLYFSQAQQSMNRRLDQRPRIWERQTIREYLRKHRYVSLVEMLGRLERARFPKYE